MVLAGLPAKLLGASLKGTIAGMIKGFAPTVGISPAILTAIAAYLGYTRATGAWKDFAEGVLLASGGQIIAPIVTGVVGKFVPTIAPAATPAAATPTATSPQVTLEELAAREADMVVV